MLFHIDGDGNGIAIRLEVRWKSLITLIEVIQVVLVLLPFIIRIALSLGW